MHFIPAAKKRIQKSLSTGHHPVSAMYSAAACDGPFLLLEYLRNSVCSLLHAQSRMAPSTSQRSLQTHLK